MACRIVLHAVVGDKQLLPLTPFTYNLVLALAFGTKGRSRTVSSKLVSSVS
jgi:hypothetical protein